jgi:hypothetical protein
MLPQKLILFSILYSLFFILYSPIFAQEVLAPQSPPQADDVGTPSAYPELPPPETGFKLTVSPPVLDLQTTAGNPITAEIRVKSFNDHPEDIHVSLMKFVANETGEKAQLLEIESTDLFPAWVTFSEDRFILEPETWKTITVTYSPPQNAPPAQYFTIVFNRQKEVELVNGQVAKGAAAVLVLSQATSSRVYRQLDLSLLDGNRLGFKTDRQVYEFLPVTFETTITNAGNIHEMVRGNIFIDWNTGRQNGIGTLEVNPEMSFTLPQTTRTFISKWTDGFPVWEEILDDAGNPILDKDGNPTKKLKWDFNNLLSFRIGKYSATLVLIYNDGQRDIPIEAETSFWVIPWRILLVLLVVIILLGFGLKNLIQGAHRRIRRLRQRFD